MPRPATEYSISMIENVRILHKHISVGKGKAYANDALSEQGGEYSELQMICKGEIWVGGQCKPGSKAAGNSTIDSLSQQGLETSSCKMIYVKRFGVCRWA